MTQYIELEKYLGPAAYDQALAAVTAIENDHTVYPSRHAIGDTVLFGPHGVSTQLVATVKRVTFSKSKVTYDLDLDGGGETLRNVDSCFVEAV